MLPSESAPSDASHACCSVTAQLPWLDGVQLPDAAPHSASVLADPSEQEPPAVNTQSAVLSGQSVAPSAGAPHALLLAVQVRGSPYLSTVRLTVLPSAAVTARLDGPNATSAISGSSQTEEPPR